jgi:type IV secretory pathway TraG/TraD family ATPase VirD4
VSAIVARVFAEIAALTRGSAGLELAYASAEIGLLIGLVRHRAPLSKVFLSPLVALPVTVASGMGMSFLSPLMQALGAARDGLWLASIGTAVTAALGYGAARFIGTRSATVRTHRRGAVLTTEIESGAARARTGSVREREQAQGVTLCGVKVAQIDETKHFKLIGTTGTGKSTAIQEMLRAAFARGDRAVIADPDGGYMRRFYRSDRDIVLNPFEAESVKWDLFGEIQQPYDIEQLARSLIPDHEGSDRSWRGYGRTLFTAVARQAHSAKVSDLGELFRLLVIAGNAELRTLVAGTPAQPFLEEHNVKMFDSIRSVTISAVAALEHVARQNSRAFSVREWVRQGAQGNAQDGGVLFIPYRAGQVAALRSQISAWMRLAIFEAMNGPESDQRLWFVVDELDALGPIDGLKDALARLRKFGGRCVLGFQSIAQVSSTYGDGDAHTIVENCGNTLILRCSASEGGGTSRFASNLIGEREVMRTTESRSRRPGDWFATRTYSDHVSTEQAILASQIEQLPDLAGFLKLASRPEWRRVVLEHAEARPDPSARASAREARTLWRTLRAGAQTSTQDAEAIRAHSANMSANRHDAVRG